MLVTLMGCGLACYLLSIYLIFTGLVSDIICIVKLNSAGGNSSTPMSQGDTTPLCKYAKKMGNVEVRGGNYRF